MAKNFLIVGTQRTGSQALFNALNLHPDIVCGGEWTQNVPPHQKLRFTERALAGDFGDPVRARPKDMKRIEEFYQPGVTWLGFKILFRSSDKWLLHPRVSPALLIDRLESYIRWLESHQDIHIIQLVRQDPIEWLKSKYVSRATKLIQRRAYPDDTKIVIPVASARRALAAKKWIDHRLEKLRQTNPYKRVNYEDFLADNRRELEACVSFLGCDLGKLPEEGDFLKPQSKRPASDYIVNYQELAAAIQP